jgi:hypothetical protein
LGAKQAAPIDGSDVVSQPMREVITGAAALTPP